MPSEADELTEAPRVADDRMYLHKQRHRPSAGRQSVDVLVTVLSERDSDLAHHLADVADLAWQFVQRHTLIGERILAAAPSLGSAARIVRSTHERWDGSGYPDALAGREIPLGARIIAVCDAFDAMTTRRSYALTLTREEALQELLRCAGTQFDAEVVDTFAAVQSDLNAELVA